MQVIGGKAMLMQYMIFIFKVVVSKNVSKMHQTRLAEKHCQFICASISS